MKLHILAVMVFLSCNFSAILMLQNQIKENDSKYIRACVKKYILYLDVLRDFDFVRNFKKKKQIETNLAFLKRNLISFSNKSSQNANLLSEILDQVLLEKINTKQ